MATSNVINSLLKKRTLNAIVSQDGLSYTFDFSSFRGYHGIMFVSYFNNDGGRRQELLLTSWSTEIVSFLVQNNMGARSESGYIEKGDYSVTFTRSLPVSSAVANVYFL